MLLPRNIDLSVYYFLKGLLPANITVVDGYPTNTLGMPDVGLALPTVAAERVSLSIRPYQLGGKGLAYYLYVLTVYARTKTERDDITYTIQDQIDDANIPVNDYNMGFPPDVVPSGIGTLVLDGPITSDPIFVFPDMVEKLYWQSEIRFTAYFSPKEN